MKRECQSFPFPSSLLPRTPSLSQPLLLLILPCPHRRPIQLLASYYGAGLPRPSRTQPLILLSRRYASASPVLSPIPMQPFQRSAPPRPAPLPLTTPCLPASPPCCYSIFRTHIHSVSFFFFLFSLSHAEYLFSPSLL